MNVFVTLRVLGWEAQPRQVVILDAHPPGPLDALWPVVAAGGGPAALSALQQAQQQQAAGGSAGGSNQSGVHPWDVRVPDASMAGGSRLLVRRVDDFKASGASARGVAGQVLTACLVCPACSGMQQHAAPLLALALPRTFLPPALPPVPTLQGPVLFRHAAFVPPGYASLLFAHLHEPSSCPLPTTLFAGFRHFMLEAFGLVGSPGSGAAARGSAAAAAAGAGGGSGADDGDSAGGGDGEDSSALTIYLITRRPGRGKGRMARQIGNEPELVASLQALSGSEGVGQLAVSLLDFAGLPSECPLHSAGSRGCQLADIAAAAA